MSDWPWPIMEQQLLSENERLRAVNAELVRTLETLNAWSNNSQQQVWCEARAAIAKAREK